MEEREVVYKPKLRLMSRRRFFWRASVLAASAALSSISTVSARPLPPDGDTSIPPSPFPRQRGESEVFDLSLRSKDEAIRDYLKRRYWEEMRGMAQPNPLGRILATTSLSESRLGLANWPILEEVEDLSLGHFTFPISPYTTMVDDGSQRFLLLSNTNIIANFRQREYLEQVHRRMFDRAVWAMDNGRIGTATIEFDRGLTPQKASYIVRLLSQYGVKTIIWGNEPNDPFAPWRDNLPELFAIYSAAADTINQFGLTDIELSWPGLAYYGQGEYLQKMIQTQKELLKRNGAREPAKELPVQRVADHYYGPVEQFLPRLRMMRDIMAKEGVGYLKYDLTEVGNPTLGPGQQKASDEQLAECHIPQLSSLAIGSGMVDRFYYYSLLGSQYEDSLTVIQDGRLVRRASYLSFVIMARLLARLDKVSLTEEQELVRLEGVRTDGIGFTVAWSKVSDRDLTVAVPRGQQVFNALGQESKDDRPSAVVLRRKQHPSLAGPARIIISRPS